jgi:alcohol dehydrogenase class IV
MSDQLPTSLIGRYEWQRQWQSVIYGDGVLSELRATIEERDARRVMLITTPSIEREGSVLKNVEDALGDLLVGRFDECRQYTPRSTVFESVALARDLQPDLLVSLGGGSVVDTAKATALALCEGLTAASDLDRYQGSGANACQLGADPIPVIALPTTLSGAEYTPMIAVTNEASGDREPFQNSALAPRVVLLDPQLTRATPDYLWLTTGIKNFSDAFEQYSNGLAGPVMEPLTLRSFEWLVRNLPGSRIVDSEARLRCQIASWLTLFGTFSAGTKVGIGAAIRHQLGMLHGIGHGEATCGILVRVVENSAPSSPDLLLPLCRAAGVQIEEASAAESRSALAGKIDALLAELGLPRSLKELGIRSEHIGELARRSAGDFAARSRSARVWTAEEVQSLLESSL